MRLFVAINFSEELKEEIGRTIEKLVSDFPQVAWTRKENIHLTIKFLGNIKKKFQIQSTKSQINSKSKIQNYKDDIVEKIKQGIEKSSVGIKPFELVFEKLGFFEREQLIVWLGAKTTPQLELLVRQLDIEMENLGFKKERREFTPHITVGRGKHIEQKILQRIKQILNTEQFILPKPFSVSAIALINSALTPNGPIYTPVCQFALY
ncbi:RNA 2',3'-cyclic phosphodiesterase [Candidatus Gottesmanbacteria bacterium]|nr:RNA 2',3'-cyclic phosphodiesterase [Candidatus Gottesmanbacteria bacterium]